jgi:putative hydrolases of HD superfamily
MAVEHVHSERAEGSELTDRQARLDQQVGFLVAIDALKTVLRQSLIADGSRRENTAEHSWQLAMAAIVLSEHADEPVNAARVTEMLLVHDLVEIDAGDTFVYADAATLAAQEAIEAAAADRIFGLLPSDQGNRLRAVWDEFESRATPEARFAKAVDRLMPMVLNRAAGGGSWSAHQILPEQTRALVESQIRGSCDTLADYAHVVITAAVAEGAYGPS